MKTFIKQQLIATCIAICASLFTTGQTLAAEPLAMDDAKGGRTTTARSLEKALSRHMIFPLDKKGDDMVGVVHVSFNVNKEGRLEVLECRSTNEALADHVRTKLDKVVVPENPTGIWKTTHIRFVFRPEGA